MRVRAARLGDAAAIAEVHVLKYPTAILWVLGDNPRARRFYEREGWTLDGGHRQQEVLDLSVPEVRYRIVLDA